MVQVGESGGQSQGFMSPNWLPHRPHRRPNGFAIVRAVPVAANSLHAPFPSFRSVEASKPAWLLNNLSFFDPSADASATLRKSSHCADSIGVTTLRRIETPKSACEAD